MNFFTGQYFKSLNLISLNVLYCGELYILGKEIDQHVPLLLFGLINIEAIKELPSVATKQTGCFLETKFENEPSILAIQPLRRSKCSFLKGANCLFLPR